MSLSASDRFGGASGAAMEGRRAVVVGASVALHGVLLVGMVAFGHRAVLREVPPVSFEMSFEAPAVPMEVAVAAAAPKPTEVVMPAAASSVTPAPADTSAPAAANAAPEPASPAEVPLADEGRLASADIVPPPMAEARPAPVRRPVPMRVVARTVLPERHVARPSEAPASTAIAPSAPAVAASAAPPPVRTVSISAQWRGEVAGWIRARTRYPESAKERGEQGAVVISFTVGRDGQVIDSSLRQRSGSETLDEAALAMFRSARVPAFPPDMDAAQVTISVPVRYRLEE